MKKMNSKATKRTIRNLASLKAAAYKDRDISSSSSSSSEEKKVKYRDKSNESFKPVKSELMLFAF